MRIHEHVTREVEVDETVDILCNRCGQSCAVDAFNERVFCGMVEATVRGGYESPVLPDALYLTFSLCEPCLGEMFSSFKIPPEADDAFGGCRENGVWRDGKYIPDSSSNAGIEVYHDR